jgi:hypothetical protein
MRDGMNIEGKMRDAWASVAASRIGTGSARKSTGVAP